ncbi:MAG TPA: HEAT repeat domain-containing protein [Bryobacteraceae bacterium]|nr:HEAT repeat domain-containing protein [Bryobacteraceae bacterium]
MRQRVERKVLKALRREFRGHPSQMRELKSLLRTGYSLERALGRLFWRLPSRSSRIVQRVFARSALDAFTRGADFAIRFDAIDRLGCLRSPPVTSFLIAVLKNRAEDVRMRGRAAETLALHETARATRALISSLDDPAVEVRFWAVFALGSHPARKAIPAVEAMLGDHAVLPGWWSVAQEAEAVLDSLRTGCGRSAELQTRVEAILADEHASAEDRRWAECYDVRACVSGSRSCSTA